MNFFQFRTITTLLLLGSFITLTACENKPIDPNTVVPDPGTGTDPGTGSGAAGKAGH